MTHASPVSSSITRTGLSMVVAGVLLSVTQGCKGIETGGESLVERSAADPDENGEDGKSAGSSKADKKRKEKMRAKTKEIEKAERGLHVAQLELKLARRAADEDLAEHEWAVAQAALESEKADRALAQFEELERPLKEAERVLSIDRAERRLHDARTDLEGILAIYEEETEASSRDEIIARHRRTVEFAERALAIEKQRAEIALRNDDQQRERDLNRKVEKAKRAVDHEQHEREQARVRSELSLMKKEHALIEIEEGLQELRTALRKLKKASSE